MVLYGRKGKDDHNNNPNTSGIFNASGLCTRHRTKQTKNKGDTTITLYQPVNLMKRNEVNRREARYITPYNTLG
jgi:hypothetical protein